MTGRLGEYCHFLNGGTPSKEVAHFFEGDIPWITSADITGPIANSARAFITDEAINRSATNKVAKGTVLLVTRTGVGKVAIAGQDLCFSQDITAIQPDPRKLDTGYLVHYLKTKQSHFERLARGATIKGITRDVVKELIIPLPPLKEQRRIAAILNQADALRAKRREALAQLNKLTQSIFIEMFGDQRPIQKITKREKLGKLIEINPKLNSEERSLIGSSVSFVPMAAIDEHQKKIVKHFERPFTEVSKGYTAFKRNDILLAKITPCYENGKMAISSNLSTEIGFGSTEFHVLRSSSSEMILFVFHLLQLAWIAEAGARSMKGAAGQKRVPSGFFENLDITVPSGALLRAFADKIQSIDALKIKHSNALTEIDALLSSLQHRAFRGGL